MTKLSSTEPFQLHTDLVTVITTAKNSFVVMGRLLSALRGNDKYLEAVGLGVDTWDDYLAQPEISLSRSEANRLVQIYEHFVSRLGYTEGDIGQIPLKNIHYLLPIIKDMETKEETDPLVADATMLTQKDFRERVYDIKTGSDERTFEYLLMEKCIETGSLRKVHGMTHLQIKDGLGL